MVLLMPRMKFRLAERPEIDRWIISELNTLIKLVETGMDSFEPTRAYRAVQEFVTDKLSNWYVRLCRRRFWKGEYGPDKIAAYQTLYTCLETVAHLSASLAPFFMDRLYQDLNGVTGRNTAESVHMADFPGQMNMLLTKSWKLRCSWLNSSAAWSFHCARRKR
jgi:isoleucyl-tRNA synthetase